MNRALGIITTAALFGLLVCVFYRGQRTTQQEVELKQAQVRYVRSEYTRCVYCGTELDAATARHAQRCHERLPCVACAALARPAEPGERERGEHGCLRAPDVP